MPPALAGLAAAHAISFLVLACNRLSNPRSDVRGENRKAAVEFYILKDNSQLLSVSSAHYRCLCRGYFNSVSLSDFCELISGALFTIFFCKSKHL